jgi:hypothetical protein
MSHPNMGGIRPTMFRGVALPPGTRNCRKERAFPYRVTAGSGTGCGASPFSRFLSEDQHSAWAC